ncbi:MAG: M15 family metallopeptidase [Armatimonadetes bacterium]|nr:M15 family metallopeptidase [Candidatus Hippobium faecium]
MDGFYIKEIDSTVFERINGISYKENDYITLKDLRYIHILHKNLKKEILEGEMIVNKYFAPEILEIFEELYKADYPIERVRLVDEYGGSDDLSMKDNNSSCFNYRPMTGSKNISKHALGLAVDINTLYNPYYKKTDTKEIIEPLEGAPFVDRTKDFPYKIDHNDLAYRLFTAKGFEWGGDWKKSKDYQHFEIPDSVCGILYYPLFR